MTKKLAVILFICLTVFSLQSEETSIGLALSGGGARGLAHIGVLKVFDEIGLQIDFISGTSMGAVVAGLYSAGYSALEIEDIVLHQFDWNFLQYDDIGRSEYHIGEKRWANYYNVSFLLSDNFIPTLPQGFINGNQFLNLFFDYTYHYTHIRDFTELPIPYASVATDVLTGETIILKSGSLHEAFRASMSVPSIFTPFDLDGRLLIDGGIRMNLPSSLVWEMGADYVIGVKVTSDLRDRTGLTSPVAVLDQTINISTAERTLSALDDCSLVIEPQLVDLSATDFNRAVEMIAAGERAARENLPELQRLVSEQHRIEVQKTPLPELPETIIFDNIYIEGNRHISGSKIRDYTGLRANTLVTKEDLIRGTRKAYNSNLFNLIYPVIIETDEGYDLILRVEEKQRNRLGINVRYNDRDDLILGSIIEMRNYIANNSSLIAGFSIGGQREFLIDYVKNFGREWGVYFRLFPYLNEHTLYFYNEEQEKTARSKSLEYGSLIGIGAFALNRFIIESYLFGFQKRLYSDIAEIHVEEDYFSGGVGLKFYHETLDDYVFPLSGHKILMKYSHADKNFIGDFSYNKFYGRFQKLLPIFPSLSFCMQFEYGSFFDDEPVTFDPFYVGGFDSFLGLHPYEKSAPVIKILTLSNRLRITDNLFVDLQFNLANADRFDLWEINDSTLIGGGLKVGYMTLLGPLRGGTGLRRDGKVLSYISLGYDFDAFEFSRR